MPWAIAWTTGIGTPTRSISINQTPTGFAELQRRILAIAPDPRAVLVVMEATGTSWMRLATPLIGSDLAVSVINPAQAHAFAKA